MRIHTAAVFLTLSLFLTAALCASANAAPNKAGATGAKDRSKTAAAPSSSPLSAKVRKALFGARIQTLAGQPSRLGAHKGKVLLLVNVASKCGLTPQYTQLEALQKKYAKRGFSVVGFPCNQFGGQEPGTAGEIATFCSQTYGVSFPMFEKIDVNGEKRHPIYRALTKFPDQKGADGNVQWNFEKFVISADGSKIWRFRPLTKPDDAAIVSVIESSLPN